MQNCPKCGYEIFEESKFCPACGSPVNAKKPEDDYQPNPVEQYPFSQKDPFGTPVRQQDPFSQPDPFEPAAYSSGQNSYNLFGQSYQQPIPRVKREKHIIFIFVTVLIFMIILIGRSLLTLLLIPDLQKFRGFAQNAYIAGILNILCAFVVCAAVLIFFILACISKNTGKDIQKRIRSSEILFIFSITVFLLGIVYSASEIYFTVISGPYYTDFDMVSEIAFVFIFHATFIIFSIMNIVKSSAFKRDLRQKLQDADNSKLN